MSGCYFVESERLADIWLNGAAAGWKEIPLDCQEALPSSPSKWIHDHTTWHMVSSDTKPKQSRQDRLKAFWAKSDAAIASGMPVLSVDEISEEVSKLRGNAKGDF